MFVHVPGVLVSADLLPVACPRELPAPPDPLTYGPVVHIEPLADVYVGMSQLAEAEEFQGHLVIDLGHLCSPFYAIVVILW